MDRHQRVVLQQRVGAGTVVAGMAPVTDWNGLAGPASSRKKNAATTNIITSAHADERVAAARRRNHRQVGDAVAGEDERPQEDRALERAHRRGHVVERRRGPRAVVGDEGQREVAGDQRPLHGDHGQRRAGQHEPDVDGARAHEAAAVLHDAEHQRDPTEDGGGQAERDAGHAERAVHRAIALTARCRGRGPGSWPCTRSSCFTSIRSLSNVAVLRSDPRRPPPGRPGTDRSARHPGSARGRWHR